MEHGWERGERSVDREGVVAGLGGGTRGAGGSAAFPCPLLRWAEEHFTDAEELQVFKSVNQIFFV